MNETLWRNGVLLGKLVIPTPATRGGIAGLFVPTPAYTDIAALSQVRMRHLPGTRVFEQLRLDQTVSARAPHVERTSYTTGTVYPLKH